MKDHHKHFVALFATGFFAFGFLYLLSLPNPVNLNDVTYGAEVRIGTTTRIVEEVTYYANSGRFTVEFVDNDE